MRAVTVAASGLMRDDHASSSPPLLYTAGFTSATPELLASRALLQRTDTKFLLSLDALGAILPGLAADYALLRAAGEPMADYRTLYFDTKTRRCLDDHRRGRRPRFKVRIRHYTDRRVSYLEVKRKDNRGRTDKARLAIPYLSEVLAEPQRAFIAAHAPGALHPWEPTLRTDFRRITLVGTRTEERATVDLGLRFHLPRGERAATLGAAVIFEVKQRRYGARSPVMLALREAGIRPTSISKFCAASVSLDPTTSMPRYAAKLRRLREVANV